MICEKRYGFYISLLIQVCRLFYLLGAKLEKIQKTLLLVFGLIWS